MADLQKFHAMVSEYYRRGLFPNGPISRKANQADLAVAINLSPSELNRRLNGKAQLSAQDIHRIVQTLAKWGVITTVKEAIELLQIMETEDFSPAQWNASPLVDLVRSYDDLPNMSVRSPFIQSKNSSDEMIAEALGSKVRLIKISKFRAATNEEIRQYYEGAPLRWDIIAAQGDVERDISNDIIRRVSLFNDQVHMLCLVGEPGSGKSTLAWRVAADVSKITNRPLLHFIDNTEDDAWYKLEGVFQQYKIPMIVLIDDVFRDKDAVRALMAIRNDLDISIISTARSNEFPDDLRLPFPINCEEIGAPTSGEKERVLHKLEIKSSSLTWEQRQRLQKANSWLVLMMETTTGDDLMKIIANSVNSLRQQDEKIYKAYEYLCYAGQFDLAVPESLIQALDDKGQFYNLVEHPIGKGLIFARNDHFPMLRTQHATIAREAWKMYRRDPKFVIKEFINVVQLTDQRRHRNFIRHLINRIILNQQIAFIRGVLEETDETMKKILMLSGTVELLNWAEIYRSLGFQQKFEEITNAMLKKIPETPGDWIARIRLAEREGTKERLVNLINSAASWLTNHPHDTQVRVAYMGILERHGSKEQIANHITNTNVWLAKNWQDAYVRLAHLAIVERKGTREQILTLIDSTSIWLASHPQEMDLRIPYAGLIAKYGTQEQLASFINTTAELITINPHDSSAYRAYLTLIKRYATPEQLSAVIDATTIWLANNPQDSVVRQAYLGLIKLRRKRMQHHEAQDQIKVVMDNTAIWLTDNPQDSIIRQTYLGLIRRYGTKKQLALAIKSTAVWLVVNPQDNMVRAAFLGLLKLRKTQENVSDFIDSAASWLVANPSDSVVRESFLQLVERRGSLEQIKATILTTAEWLATNFHNYNIRAVYFRLVEHHGNQEQIRDLINVTYYWLVAHSYDAYVRNFYIRLVERHGTQEQIEMARELATIWLSHSTSQQNRQAGKIYLRLEVDV